MKTLKLSQSPESKNWFIFSLLSKGNRSFHAWDPWGSNPKISLYYQPRVQNKSKRKEENELYPRQNQQNILLTLAGTEIQRRAAAYFKRFQGKPVGFNKHTSVGVFFQSAIEKENADSPISFSSPPWCNSEIPAIFEMVEHHFFWSNGADPSFAHLCHMQSEKYLMDKQWPKDPSTAAEVFNQFGSGNAEAELDQMYKEPVSRVTWL